MSYAAPSASHRDSYREMEIQAAGAEKLLCIVFEQLVVNLERARISMERQDIELRVVSLRRARNILTELLATLDFEKGGAIAIQLADLYQFMLYELVDIGQRGDVVTMRKLVNIASQLRDGFVGAQQQLASQKQLRSA
ncbi:flagellar export chaperone FliS [Gemmatimonas phototrophica]|nr:flagellar export chaperone FliS [Gemmatimonas phototrophica]